MAFISVEEIEKLWKPLTDAETDKVEALLPVVSDLIIAEGVANGVDVESRVDNEPAYETVVKVVCLAMVKRAMTETDDSMNYSQLTQSALGYSVSGTYVNSGGAMALLPKEVKMLGFKRQKVGIVTLC